MVGRLALHSSPHNCTVAQVELIMCTRKSTRVRHVGFRWAHAHGALHAVAMATAHNVQRARASKNG